VPWRDAALGDNAGSLGDDQPEASGREGAQVHEVPIGRDAVVGRAVLAHGGDEGAVLEFKTAQGQRLEEIRIRHGVAFRGTMCCRVRPSQLGTTGCYSPPPGAGPSLSRIAHPGATETTSRFDKDPRATL